MTTHWTTLTYATDGAVAQKLMQDPLLRPCESICIDDVHEESPCLDMAIRQIITIIGKRPGFNVVQMSADPENCLMHFDNLPLIPIPGRQRPVDILEAHSDYY